MSSLVNMNLYLNFFGIKLWDLDGLGLRGLGGCWLGGLFLLLGCHFESTFRRYWGGMTLQRGLAHSG